MRYGNVNKSLRCLCVRFFGKLAVLGRKKNKSTLREIPEN